MSQAPIASHSTPSGPLLAASTVTLTAVSFVAWLIIVLVTVFGSLSTQWMYTGLALPGMTLGSIAAHIKGRPAYFWLGLAITSIPLVAFVVLAD